jgi:Flp pilus assembly protein TadB
MALTDGINSYATVSCALVFASVLAGFWPSLMILNSGLETLFFRIFFMGDETKRILLKEKAPFAKELWLASTILISAGLYYCHLGFLIAVVVPGMFFLPTFIFNEYIKLWKVKFRSQLPLLCSGLANTTRAGISLEAGFMEIAPELPNPLGAEVNLIVGKYNAGMDFRKCVGDSKEKVGIPAYSMLTAAILTCKDRGGPINSLLEKLGQSVRDIERLERKMENATTVGMKTIRFLSVFPFLFLLLMALIYEGGVMMFTTMIGQFLLLACTCIVFAANYWASVIASMDM